MKYIIQYVYLFKGHSYITIRQTQYYRTAQATKWPPLRKEYE
jgi:hypothetical protein